jgi:hypothetical protein
VGCCDGVGAVSCSLLPLVVLADVADKERAMMWENFMVLVEVVCYSVAGMSFVIGLYLLIAGRGGE